MNWRKKIHDKVKRLIEGSETLTYRTSIVYLERYCEGLRFFSGYDNFEKSVINFLDTFKQIEDLTNAKIESNFNDFVQEFFVGMINMDFFSKLKGGGVYVLYNEYDEIIYIGKTRHLDKRPLQSFLCKFPLGAVYLKILDINDFWIDIIEAIMIDYFLPIYNSQKKSVDMTHRNYSKKIDMVKLLLKKGDKIYPTSKKYNWLETEKNIFDNIEEALNDD